LATPQDEVVGVKEGAGVSCLYEPNLLLLLELPRPGNRHRRVQLKLDPAEQREAAANRLRQIDRLARGLHDRLGENRAHLFDRGIKGAMEKPTQNA
jgi:hypothetical protein